MWLVERALQSFAEENLWLVRRKDSEDGDRDRALEKRGRLQNLRGWEMQNLFGTVAWN